MANKKSIKVNCSFCGKEIECPENMLNSKKHMCYDCFQNAGELAKGEDLGKVHVDIPMDKMDEMIPENLTNSLVEEAFPDVWKERKEELKAMSKHNLAEEMFGAINDGFERGPLFAQLSVLTQAENLESAAVCEYGSFPGHEFVQASGLFYDIMSRPQIKVIGITQYDLSTQVFQFARRARFDCGVGADRHEYRRMYRAMRRF